MNVKLDKKNLADLASDLSTVSTLSDTFFDKVRKTLADVGDKIQADNCGTTLSKQEYFEGCLTGLVDASTLPDSSMLLSQAITEITKKL